MYIRVGSVLSIKGEKGVVIIHEDDEESPDHGDIVLRMDSGVIRKITAQELYDLDDDIQDVTPELYVNVYLHNRAYGGPEEGGWWYDTYDPVYEECRVAFTEEEAKEIHKEMLEWMLQENAVRRDVSSVISEGRYVVSVEGFPPRRLPLRRPYYC